ncbi:MAG: inositol oxygenase family protein, partial [Verrucomicrobiota bacterium]|nr:inositol oxygenase family protein [Verrucomicrobiota bacterium]
MNTHSDAPSENDSHDIMEEWDEFVKKRYPTPANQDPADFTPTDPEKKESEFRDYAKEVRPSVRRFYEENHIHQTYDFVMGKKKEFTAFNRREMG